MDEPYYLSYHSRLIVLPATIVHSTLFCRLQSYFFLFATSDFAIFLKSTFFFICLTTRSVKNVHISLRLPLHNIGKKNTHTHDKLDMAKEVSTKSTCNNGDMKKISKERKLLVNIYCWLLCCMNMKENWMHYSIVDAIVCFFK